MSWTKESFQEAARTRGVWRLYAERGTLRPAPEPIEALPGNVQRRVAGLVARHRGAKDGECYLTVFRAVEKQPKGLQWVEWVEGLTAGPGTRVPVPHAWLEVEGHTVDLGSILSRPVYPIPGWMYFGVAYAPEEIVRTMRARGYVEPMCVVHAPAPPRGARTCTVCDGERTLTFGPVTTECGECSGEGWVLPQAKE